MTEEPMTLERALEVAISNLAGEVACLDEFDEAAAVLRAFMETGLPWMQECERFCNEAEDWLACDINMGKLYAAYVAHKEATK